MNLHIEGWREPIRFLAAGLEHYVYVGGKGPPVVLMHELPGLSRETTLLAETIRDDGYSVHMPLLVGRPLENKPATNFLRLCISHEIFLFAANRTSPIVDWLRAYITTLATPEMPRIGVVGMCLTGNFALTLVAEREVAGSVVCQPSLPLSLNRNGLAMDADDWSAVCRRARSLDDEVGVLLMKYDCDWRSPIKRFDRIVEGLGSAVKTVVCPGKGHSTLTYDQNPEALDALRAFLRKRLLQKPM